MDEPRKVIIHPALNRPKLMMGIEREPLILSATLCFMVGFNTWRISKPSVLIVVLCWFVILLVLRRVSKDDPIRCAVFLREVEYRDWYPAKSFINSKPVPVAGRWKR